MKKNILFILLLSVLLIVTTACGKTENRESNNSEKIEVSGQEKESITLKMAIYQPATHAIVSETLEPFMERVTEETNGQVQFELYPAEQLGKAGDMLDITSNGVADIGYYISSYFPSQMSITNPLLGLPGVYTTAVEGTMAYHEVAKKSPILEKDFLNNGVRNIFTYALPQSEFFSKGKEVRVPADLKDLKTRVSGEIGNKALASLGASPINLTVSELYEGLDRKVYNSILVNPASVRDYGLDELIESGTIGANFGGNVTGLIMNEKTFQSLPKDVQEVIIRLGDEFSISNAKFYDERTVNLIQEFRDNGVDMIDLSEEEMVEWQKFYQEFEKDWLKSVNNPDLEMALKDLREVIGEIK